MKSAFRSFVPALITLASLTAAGCGSQATPPAAEKTPVSVSDSPHAGWWCVEHAIPEEECAQCNAKLAAEFQQKGDWCQSHNRPESQCFICHPELEVKFAARYEAKFGSKPPAREE